jgi:2-methylisocitrate lyase-like PEP mutase family enzyme
MSEMPEGPLRQSLKTKLNGPLPVTAPLVLNPLMARLVEDMGFGAGYLGGGSTGYQKVVLEANLNLTEMCQTAIDIGAVSSLPLIFDGACGFGDPMHMHRTIGMSEAAGFAAIEVEDQLVPKRAHHHIGIEHMIPQELMAAKVREAVAARRNPEFLIIARTNAMRRGDLDEALRRGEAYRAAGADVLLLSMARQPEQLRAIGERLGGPLMYLTGRGGLAGSGMTLRELGDLGYRIVADPTTPLIVAYAAWKRTYATLADGFGAGVSPDPAWPGLEQDMLGVIGLEKLLAVERATVEIGDHAG